MYNFQKTTARAYASQVPMPASLLRPSSLAQTACRLMGLHADDNILEPTYTFSHAPAQIHLQIHRISWSWCRRCTLYVNTDFFWGQGLSTEAKSLKVVQQVGQCQWFSAYTQSHSAQPPFSHTHTISFHTSQPVWVDSDNTTIIRQAYPPHFLFSLKTSCAFLNESIRGEVKQETDLALVMSTLQRTLSMKSFFSRKLNHGWWRRISAKKENSILGHS